MRYHMHNGVTVLVIGEPNGTRSSTSRKPRFQQVQDGGIVCVDDGSIIGELLV